jgi:hypothetical protein
LKSWDFNKRNWGFSRRIACVFARTIVPIFMYEAWSHTCCKVLIISLNNSACMFVKSFFAWKNKELFEKSSATPTNTKNPVQKLQTCDIMIHQASKYGKILNHWECLSFNSV